MGPFAEALRATVQPCTFLLIVPTLAVSIALRNRWSALGAIVGAAIVGGWLLAANWFVVDGIWVRVAAVIVATALVVTLPQVHERAPVFGTEGAGVAVAGTVTFVATLWWRPCVGAELGTILNGAQDGLAAELLPMAFYMLGTTVPVAIVVFAQHAIAPPERVARLASWAAVVVLTRWTLE